MYGNVEERIFIFPVMPERNLKDLERRDDLSVLRMSDFERTIEQA
jgi:hypothetical protein